MLTVFLLLSSVLWSLRRVAGKYWTTVCSLPIFTRKREFLLFAGLLQLWIQVFLLIKHGIPKPVVHDEWSILLGADQIAHFTFKETKHVLWEFFESAHVLAEPYYASKYPPAKSFIYGVSQLLTGEPFLGVLFSSILAQYFLAAVIWIVATPLLRAPLLGLISFHPLVVQWSQSYWGGTVNLMFGSWITWIVLRFIQDNIPRCSLWALALPLSGLLMCRPFEGGLFFTALCTVIFIQKKGGRLYDFLSIGLVSAVSAIPLLAYNTYLTGFPFLFPHVQYHQQYLKTPLFWWLPTQLPSRNPLPEWIGLLDQWFEPFYLERQSIPGLLRSSLVSLGSWLESIFGLPLAVSLGLLILIALAARSKEGTYALVAIIVSAVTMLSLSFHWPHYSAQLFVFFIIALAGLRRLKRSVRFYRIGLTILSAIVLHSIALYLLTLTFSRPKNFSDLKSQVESAFTNAAERTAVFVRYASTHSVHHEWVYNGWNIDSHKVVWLHDLGEKKNQEAVQYYKDRRLHLLEVNNFEIKSSEILRE